MQAACLLQFKHHIMMHMLHTGLFYFFSQRYQSHRHIKLRGSVCHISPRGLECSDKSTVALFCQQKWYVIVIRLYLKSQQGKERGFSHTVFL